VELAVFFFFLRPDLAASFLAAMAAARSYSSAWFSLFSSTLLMPCSSSGIVGRLVVLQWLEEELEELSVQGGRGGIGRRREGEGVAREADSSGDWPGHREGDGFLVPECGKKLAREKEAATAPHS